MTANTPDREVMHKVHVKNRLVFNELYEKTINVIIFKFKGSVAKIFNSKIKLQNVKSSKGIRIKKSKRKREGLINEKKKGKKKRSKQWITMLESYPRVSPLSLGSMWSTIRIEPQSITLLLYYYFYFWWKALLFYCTIVTPAVFFNGHYRYLMLMLMRKCYL